MEHRYISNAQWPLNVYLGMDGKGISTDTHESKEGAIAVCQALQKEGFGGTGQGFPTAVWVEEIDHDNGGAKTEVWRSGDIDRHGSVPVPEQPHVPGRQPGYKQKSKYTRKKGKRKNK